MTNIVVIAIDDLTPYRLLRNTFGQAFLTPNLDALCETATAFDSAYCIVPVCAPSREATFTGWSPWETGSLSNAATNWYDDGRAGNKIRDNVSSILRRNGYYAGWAGKIMHGYFTQPLNVQRQIADEQMPNGSFTPNLDNAVTLWPSGFSIVRVPSFPGSDAQYYDARVMQWGIERLAEQSPDKPWALFLGTQHPHTGYTAPDWAYDAFDVEAFTWPTTWSLGDLPTPSTFADQFMGLGSGYEDMGDEAWRHHMWAYLACTYHADVRIGAFLNALAASQFADDTLIVVVSDHGFNMGDHDLWNKFTLWEQAARTPLIVKGPGQTVGSVVNTPVSLMDVMPTILDAAGITQPPRLQGQSLLPLLPGGTGVYEDRGALTAVFGANSIRWGNYRYIRYPSGEEELYNIIADSAQNTNLARPDRAAANAVVINDMRNRLVIEQARYGLVTADPDMPHLTEATRYALEHGATFRGGHKDTVFHIDPRTGATVEGADGGLNEIYLAGWADDTIYTIPDGIQTLTVAVKSGSNRPTINANDHGNRIIAPMYAFIGQGGEGDDYMEGGSTSRLFGGPGNDYLSTKGNNSMLDGGTGDDTLVSSGRTPAYGGPGNDYILVDDAVSPTFVDGGSGNDLIQSGGGNDTLLGGSGDDTIFGGNGDDLIYTGPGNSIANGGNGNDTIHAQGNDTITGGAGVDTFVIGRGGTVQITDWQIGETIDLTSWAAIPEYKQVSPTSVLVWDGGRGVNIISAGPISVAQVQAAVIL